MFEGSGLSAQEVKRWNTTEFVEVIQQVAYLVGGAGTEPSTPKAAAVNEPT